MPTAGRLIAAVVLALAAWGAALAYRRTLPPEVVATWLPETVGALGLVIGWLSVGRRLGVRSRPAGAGRALAAGLQGALLVLVWAAFGFGVRQMLIETLDRRLKGLEEAFFRLAELFWLNLASAADPLTLALLIGGGVASGVLGRAALMRWG
ncbi:MAG: hypothetical protein D6832_01825 [Alphaproteobacteria bacterium]|nr:MAG: hypothetical protein D6832_01825 [Alphaproteobacteria bacterium]